MAKVIGNKELLALATEGKTPTDIGEIIGESAQKVGSMLKAARKEVDDTRISDAKILEDAQKIVDAANADKPKVANAPANTTVVTEEVERSEMAKAGEKITIRTAEEYFAYQKSQGRTSFGGKLGEKIPISVEELRAYINSKWTPSMVMEKYQLTVDNLQQAVWKLSKKELREKPISFNLKHNIFKS